ncbi:MAG: HAMP domain-containing sensor histidine kinase [Pseudomonadales bacterium]
MTSSRLINHLTEEQATEADSIVLLESVRARTSIAPISALGTFAPTILFIPFLLLQGVPLLMVAAWVVPAFFTTLARTLYSQRVIKDLDSRPLDGLVRADRWLRISSVTNQTLIGMGIWLIQSPTSEPLVLPLFVTLIIVTFSLGVMVNLFSDFRTYAISAPMLLGQPIIFWMLQEGFGWAIGTALLAATALSYALVRRGSEIFRESVLMRFETDRLLEQVESQKVIAEDALDEARAANESKAFFMAAASHDIKQPLYALGMLTDTLMMSELPTHANSILQKQRRSIDRMTHLFDDLMDLSRFERGVFELSFREVPSRELAQILDDEFEPLCREKGIDWQLKIEPVMLSTDPDLLMRLLRNLLHNALRYTDQGAIGCHAEVTDGLLKITISDTGRGIEQHDQERIFKEFIRLENPNDGNTGAGLGLAIVKYIADALDLDLQLNSQPGVGTSFHFAIPVVTATSDDSRNQT